MSQNAFHLGCDSNQPRRCAVLLELRRTLARGQYNFPGFLRPWCCIIEGTSALIQLNRTNITQENDTNKERQLSCTQSSIHKIFIAQRFMKVVQTKSAHNGQIRRQLTSALKSIISGIMHLLVVKSDRRSKDLDKYGADPCIIKFSVNHFRRPVDYFNSHRPCTFERR